MADKKLHRVEVTFVGYCYGEDQSDAIHRYLSQGVREDPSHMAEAIEVTADTKYIESEWQDSFPWEAGKDETSVLDIWRKMRKDKEP